MTKATVTRKQFLRLEWFRIAFFLAVTLSLPFIYGFDNTAGVDPFPIFATICGSFWTMFIVFMVSADARAMYVLGDLY